MREIRSRPFGVNLYGYHSATTGLATVARGLERGLTIAGVPVLAVDVPLWSDADSPRIPPPDKDRFQINLIQQNADTMRVFIDAYGSDILRGCYNIGLCFWELSVLPAQWIEHLKPLDEIWVASEFCRQAFSAAVPIPVVKIPLVIDELEEKAMYPREHFGFEPNVFVFAYIFDLHSFIERKNPLALIEAFRAEFGGSTDVLLFLKTSNGGVSNTPALYEATAGTPNIRIYNGILNVEETVSLHNAIDCLVSPHRSEGFGLNLAEAMYFGKPVVGTRYSGNLEFMTNENSYLIDYELKAIRTSAGPYTKGNVWADPSIDHLRRLMREVFEDRPGGLAKGRRASDTIRQRYNAQTAGRALSHSLNRTGNILARPPAEAKT